MGDEVLKHLIMRAWHSRGMRADNAVRHEFKGIHGFRKYYKIRAEQVIMPINVEILMGHGVDVDKRRVLFPSNGKVPIYGKGAEGKEPRPGTGSSP